jgi:hypothetical protein
MCVDDQFWVDELAMVVQLIQLHHPRVKSMVIKSFDYLSEIIYSSLMELAD